MHGYAGGITEQGGVYTGIYTGSSVKKGEKKTSVFETPMG